jgi:flagellar protein FliO/FliZ
MFGTLFGTEMPLAVRFVIAFVVVLALIGVAAWLVRRFGSSRLGGGAGRGRQQPRLAVIDAANVDGRRRLVLIRRDNIEHLLMIGGPSDVVIEPNIVRASGLRESAREPARLAPENGMRAAPLDTGWPLQPVAEPAPRTREETWTAPEPLPRPRAADTLAGLPADLSARLTPDAAHPVPPRAEPRAPAPQPDPLQDANLADMAQQLEAALRRPAAAHPASDAKPVEPPRAAMKMRIDPRIDARPEPKLEPAKFEKPEPKAAPRAVEPKNDIRPEPKIEAKPEPRLEPKSEIHVERAEPKPDAAPEVKPDAMSRKDFYDNLEEEMASLLGRPPGKS